MFNKDQIHSNVRKFGFLTILAIAIVYRLWGITNPLLDFHHFRQTYTALYAKHFFRDSMNLFFPEIDILNYTNVSEFQLYPFLVAVLYHIFGFHDILGRIVSMFFSTMTVVLIYLIGKKHLSHYAGLFAALLFAVLPLSVYYGRVFMLEPMMLFFVTGNMYFLLEWKKKRTVPLLLLALTFSALALLSKITALYIVVPNLLIFYQIYGRNTFQRPSFYLFFTGMLTPAVYWYFIHPSLFKAGIYQVENFNLYASPDIVFLNLIQLTSVKTYYKLLVERLGEYMLTIPGFLLMVLAIIFHSRKIFLHRSSNDADRGVYFPIILFLYCWMGSFILFMLLFNSINISHEYYQLPFFMPAVLIMGSYLSHVVTTNNIKNQILHLFLLLMILPFSIFRVNSRLTVDRFYLNVSKVVQEISQKDEKIIVMDPQIRGEVFYLSDRKGYLLHIPEMSPLAVFIHDRNSDTRIISEIQRFHNMGGRFLVSPYGEFAPTFPGVMKFLNNEYRSVNTPSDSATPGFVYDLNTTDSQ